MKSGIKNKFYMPDEIYFIDKADINHTKCLDTHTLCTFDINFALNLHQSRRICVYDHNYYNSFAVVVALCP